ncbi:hypothetical protein GM418_19430 [Maribellus comscasis]|uniref:Uncharacterized protein n=1 Tax=Maribellus comscasis TaxID=2681766 RepID=A0A6I6K6Z6_9BACT|nr:hypothetical protein [Maribellus comscasis]QGY45764.1 hypothetical protein GM418_19430 [Maribellus comscasis]
MVMVETIALAATILMVIFLLKQWTKTEGATGEKEKVIKNFKPECIVGKSNFVLSSDKNTFPESGSSGKMDIEVPLEYEPDINAIEEQEEMEHLGLSSEISSDITFEEMMEVVNEVESVKPQNPTKTGKLLYENDNTEWVEQMASTSPDHQKRIVALIDLHLGKLGQNEGEQVSSDDMEGFDIGEFVG